jgi:hypothetical protein
MAVGFKPDILYSVRMVHLYQTCRGHVFDIHTYLILCIRLVQYTENVGLKMHGMHNFKINGSLFQYKKGVCKFKR